MSELTNLLRFNHYHATGRLCESPANIGCGKIQVSGVEPHIVQAGETSDAEAFVREPALRVPQHEDALITIAQQPEQKGIEKGLRQGLQQGRQEGRNEGKLEVAHSLLKMGMSHESVLKATGLTEEELAQIRH